MSVSPTLTSCYQISFWRALCLPIYLISVLPAVGVWLLGNRSASAFLPIWFAAVAVCFLQHGVNVLNDGKDWQRGADIAKFESWVRFHRGNLARVEWHGRWFFGLGVALGVFVLAWENRLGILLSSAPFVLLGYAYNAGPHPLSYGRFGEWATGFCYGPGVFGSLWLLSENGASLGLGIMGSLVFGGLAVAILLAHQPGQISTDRAAGKHSFAVRYGKSVTIFSSRFLLTLSLLGFASLLVSADRGVRSFVIVAVILPLCFIVWKEPPCPRNFLIWSSGFFAVCVGVKSL